MTRVIETAELEPAARSPDFVERFATVLRGVGLPIPASFAGVSVAEGRVAERLWNLSRLVFGAGIAPDPHWAELPLFADVFVHGLGQDARRRIVAGSGPAGEAEVFIAIDDSSCPEAISAPWRFCREHVLPGLLLAVVMPPDAAWILVNYHGEFIRGCRTRFAEARSVVFRPAFAGHDGLLVPKPRYEVRFANGSDWESGDLRRDPDRKTSLDSALATVAKLAGVTVEHCPD